MGRSTACAAGAQAFGLLRRLSDCVVRVRLPGSTTCRCIPISSREAFRRSFWLRQNEHLLMQANGLRTSVAPHSRLNSRRPGARTR